MHHMSPFQGFLRMGGHAQKGFTLPFGIFAPSGHYCAFIIMAEGGSTLFTEQDDLFPSCRFEEHKQSGRAGGFPCLARIQTNWDGLYSLPKMAVPVVFQVRKTSLPSFSGYSPELLLTR